MESQSTRPRQAPREQLVPRYRRRVLVPTAHLDDRRIAPRAMDSHWSLDGPRSAAAVDVPVHLPDTKLTVIVLTPRQNHSANAQRHAVV